MKNRLLTFLLILSLFFLAFACGKFEYSPYQEKINEVLPEGLNQKNLSRLLANEKSADDTVTIVYSGDSQRFYDELEDLVNKVNTLPNIDFLVLAGDIADFGLVQEYKWITDRLKKLNTPYLCAIGNHDLIVDKGRMYTRIFGKKDYSFVYKGYKFIFHDTNGREYGFNGKIPDMDWLGKELKQNEAVHWYVGVSHMMPYDVDFDKQLEQPYKNLLASTPGFVLSLHGHLHGTTDSYYYNDGVRYMTSNSVQKSEFVLLKLIHGTVIKQMIKI